MPEDRRRALRRLEDIRDLLRFCRGFDQPVPSRVAARLAELGIEDATERPIDELLLALTDLEVAALADVPEDRRRGPRRWINPSVLEEPDEGR